MVLQLLCVFQSVYLCSKIARKIVKKVISGEETTVKVNEQNLSKFLGVKKFKFGELEEENKIGIVTGLAWTEFGGEILWGGIVFGNEMFLHVSGGDGIDPCGDVFGHVG